VHKFKSQISKFLKGYQGHFVMWNWDKDVRILTSFFE
jgi:hypothetical protein